MGKISKFALAVWITGTVSLMAVPADAQRIFHETPCGFASDNQPFAAQGLIIVEGGLIYDSNQQLCWLKDANLAGNPEARAKIHLHTTNPDGSFPVINPDGTMDWETALNLVNTLNDYNNGQGWLDHSDWQLPTNPHADTSCSSKKAGNFGVLCQGSAMGYLYNVALAIQYPESVAPRFTNFVSPIKNLQPGLYWTSTLLGDAGYSTFSFNTGDDGANTTAYNFFHVLPLTRDVLGTPAPGNATCSVLPYISGPGLGKAVFDSCTGLSWPVNANLAAHHHFGFNEKTTLTSSINGMKLPVSMIDKDGTVFFSALCDLDLASPGDPCPSPAKGWLVSMNNLAYGGSSNWTLPSAGTKGTPGDLDQLFSDLGLLPGDTRLESKTFVGPFGRLQPGFYWACVRDPDEDPNHQARCRYDLMPCDPKTDTCAPCPKTNGSCVTCDPADASAGLCAAQEYSFNFDDGFEGTDHLSKHFYVMVYYPAPRISPQ